MAGNSELFEALKMFNDGVQTLATQRAITQANEQVQQIKTSELDEAKKRAQIFGISQGLASQLATFGTPATTIQATAGALMPQLDPLTQAENEKKFKREESDATRKFQKQLNDDDNNTQLKIAGMRQDGAAKPRKSDGDVAFGANVEVAGKMLGELEAAVKRSGTYESAWFGNEEDSATLDSNPYKLAITYAKIVDPASVAREGEVAAAQKYLIELGALSNRGKVLKQISHMKKTIKQYEVARRRQQATGQDDIIEKKSSGDLSDFILE